VPSGVTKLSGGIVQLRTKEVKQVLGSLDVAYRSTLRALNSALETRDQDTRGTLGNASLPSAYASAPNGLSQGELTSLEYGALLHDIGKIGVPDAILRKPAKLTEEEWAQMRLHPQHGNRFSTELSF
jgi:HD-GYP domain-containing protein (c-di-GMP phosphodiesterase class II)